MLLRTMPRPSVVIMHLVMVQIKRQELLVILAALLFTPLKIWELMEMAVPSLPMMSTARSGAPFSEVVLASLIF